MMVCLVVERDPHTIINLDAACTYVDMQIQDEENADARRNYEAATELLARFKAWYASPAQFLYLENFERARIAWAREKRESSLLPCWTDLLERVLLGGYEKLLAHLNIKYIIRSTGEMFPLEHDTPMWFS